LWGVVALW